MDQLNLLNQVRGNLFKQINLLVLSFVFFIVGCNEIDVSLKEKISKLSPLSSLVNIDRALNQTIGPCIFTSTSNAIASPGFEYHINFTSPIDPSTFDVSDIVNTGTGGSTDLDWTLTSCGDNQNFKLLVTNVDGDGTIIPTLPANTIQTLSGSNNPVTTSASQIVTYDTTAPDLTIEQAITENVGSCSFTNVSDPTNANTFSYRVTFLEAIDPTTFTPSDVLNAGSGGGTSLVWSVISCGDNKNFRLVASSIIGDGTIIPNIGASSVQDLAGNDNTASTSVDNSVTVETTVPSVTIEQAVTEVVGSCSFTAPSDPSNTTGFSYRVNFSKPIDPSSFIASDISNGGTGGGSLLTWNIVNCGDNQNFQIIASAINGNGTIVPNLASGRVQDIAGNSNTASTSSDNTILYDSIGPSLTINQAISETVGSCSFSAASDPTTSAGFQYRIAFSEVIDTSTFTVADIVNNGTGGSTTLTWSLSNCGDDTNFMLTATTVVGDGTIVPSIGASSIQDNAGNNNSASTATDNSILFDNQQPTIVINQAVSETVGSCSFTAPSDPTNTTGFEYKVVMSEAINPATFTVADITNSGTGGGTTLTWTLVDCGDSTNFKLTAAAIVGDGTIIPNISAGVLQDLAGNANLVSTSTDNSVTYDSIAPSVTVNQAVLETVGICNFTAASDPTNTAGFGYKVTFSEVINSGTFTVSDINNSGTGGTALLNWTLTNCGDDTNFMLVASAVDGNGTIIPTIALGQIQDPAGNGNTSSTATDNSVTYLNTQPSVTINQAIAQTVGSCTFTAASDPTNTAGFEYRVTFTAPVDDSTFTAGDIVNAGTGGGTTLTWAIANCGDDTNFKLTASAVVGDGTIVPTLAAGTVSDFALNTNNASTATDNSILFDTASPSITINQAITETVGSCSFSAVTDPTNTAGFEYKVVMSEVIDAATFTVADLTNLGTGGGTSLTWALANCGDDTNFKLTASAVVGDGTIIPSVAAGVVQDLAGNTNLISTATDNTVTYDTTSPSVTINQAVLETVGTCNFTAANDPTNTAGFGYRVTASEAINASTLTTSDFVNSGTGGGTTLTWALTNCGDDTNFMLVASAVVGNGTIIPTLASSSFQDVAGNNNNTSTATDNSVTFDNSSPGVTINQAVAETVGSCTFSAASDPANAAGFEYRIAFSEPINTSSFTTADITNSGTGGGTTLTWSITNCGDDANFMLTATAVVGDGTIIPEIGAGVVQDISGNGNTLSTATDNSILFDVNQPTLTINQAVTETVGSCSFSAVTDPTNTTGFEYKVVMSEVIDAATFTVGDITNSGTGGSSTLVWSLANCGDDTNFKLTALTIVGDGTIIPSVAAGVVQDLAGNTNLISTATDNTVTYDSTSPSITINQAVLETVGSCNFTAANDPTNTAGFGYRVTASEAINASTLTTSDFVNSGTGGGTTLTWALTNCGDDTNFMLVASAVVGNGTIIPTLASSSFQDVAGNNNNASTATDNSVTFDNSSLDLTINQAVAETVGSCTFTAASDPTRNAGIEYRVTFNKPIDTASFTVGDIVNAGTGGYSTLSWTLANCGDDTNFKITANVIIGEGTIVPTVAAASVTDLAANDNNASTATDNSVLFDLTAPEITINQAVTETVGSCSFTATADPTNTAGFEYKITMSEAIDTSTFAIGDITNVGTGGGTTLTWALANCGDDTNFKLTASTVVGDGTIIPSIAGSLLQDRAGNLNNASMSGDGSVTYDTTQPSVAIEQAITETIGSCNFLNADDPTNAVGFSYKVTTSEPINTSTLTLSDFINSGTGGGSVLVWSLTNCGDDTNFMLTSVLVDGDGTIIPNLSLGAFTDKAGNISSASTSSDNSITFDETALDVAINQAGIETVGSCNFMGTIDPTDSAGFEYKITFSEPINTSTFDISDVINLGTGGSVTLTWSLVNCGDDTNFKLTVTDVDGYGTIIPSIPSEEVEDLAGNPNYLSTATDNVITFKFLGWYQEAYIKAGNSVDSLEFGKSVSLSGDTLVVGSENESSNQTTITNGTSSSLDTSSINAGAAYIYRRTGGIWQQEAYVKAVNAQSGYNFASSVSINMDTLAVGSPWEDGAQTTITNGDSATDDMWFLYTGAVYIYKRSGVTWNQEAYIKPVNRPDGGLFGKSVSLSGDTLAVGATFENSDQVTITNGESASFDVDRVSSGAVYIYKRVGLTWQQEAYIKAANSSDYDEFGTVVSINNDTLAVGVVNEDSNQTTITNGATASGNDSNDQSGAVYIYKRTGATWSQEAYIKAINNRDGYEFGKSVSLSGDSLVVGSWGEGSNQVTITNGASASSDNSASWSGAVYVYKRTGSSWQQEAYIKAINGEEDDSFGASVSLVGDTLVVGAVGESSNQTTITNGVTASGDNSNSYSGAAYVYKRNGVTWQQEAYIKAANANEDDEFGAWISLNGDTIAVSAIGESSNQNTITNGTTASADDSSGYSGAVYIYRSDARLFDLSDIVSTFDLTSITLRWLKSGGSATGYIVAYQAGPTAPADCSLGTVINVGDVDTYEVTGLTTGVTYSFRVCATNGVNFNSGITISETTDDATPPSVTINQAVSETVGSCSFTNTVDPTTDQGFSYRVVFSMPIVSSSFSASDIDNVGTGGALDLVWTIDNCGDDTNFKITATAISGGGTIIPEIKTGRVQRDNGVSNTTSTATDNTVEYIELGWYQEAYIKAANSDSNDFFGGSVALDGDTLAVGAWFEASNQTTITNGTSASADNSQNYSGAVYVYKRSGALWTQEAYIKAVNADSPDTFGSSLALEGDTLAVGAYGEASNQTTITNGTSASADNSKTYSGAVYIYRRSGATWQQEAYIKAVNSYPGYFFGGSAGLDRSLSLYDNRLAVGSHVESSNQSTITNGASASGDNSAYSSGAVYLYKRSGTTWQQEAYIKAVNNDAGMSFGASVSLSGDTLAVGAPGESSNQTTITNGATASSDDSSTASGATYIYRYSGGLWQQEAYIKAANADEYDAGGVVGLSLDHDTLSVGSKCESSNQNTIINGTTASANNDLTCSGAVYVYKRSGTLWQQEAFIKAANADYDDSFGINTSLSGDILAVGAVGESSNRSVITNGTSASLNNLSSFSGAVYVYKRSGATWQQDAYIKAINNDSDDAFGVTLSLSGDTLAVGAPQEDSIQNTITNGATASFDNTYPESGAVYIYRNNEHLFEVVKVSSEYDVNSVTLNWNKTGGIATGYIIAYQAGATAPANCSSGTVVNVGDVNSYEITGLTTGVQYSFRICATDGTTMTHGNMSQVSAIPDSLIPPSVTINQSVSETVGSCSFTATSDPTDTEGFGYRVTFSKAIDASTFTVADITNTGTGGSTLLTWTLANCGDNRNFKLTASSVTGYGTIIPIINAGQVFGVNGDANLVSTATDNSVTFSGLPWKQEAYIKAVNNGSEDQFGSSVSLNGDTLAVGVPFEDSNETTITNGTTASADNSNASSGAVYIYKRTGVAWQQEAYIKAANNDAGDEFGYSVSLSNDTLAVGARWEASNETTITNGATASSNNSLISGATYVYRRSGSTWAQEAYIKSVNSEDSDSFGFSVSLDGDTLAVAAWGEDSGQITITNGATASADNSEDESGAVYIYKRVGATWTQEAYIKASNADFGDYYGWSIELDGDTLVVGAPREDSNQTTITNGTTSSSNGSLNSAGAAYVYKRSGVSWAQEAYIKAANPDSFDSFGERISLSGNTLAVTSQFESSNQNTITNGATASADNSLFGAGAVYVYKRTGANWAQEAYIKAANNFSGSTFFGSGLSVKGNTLAVGSMGESSNQTTITNGATASSDTSNTWSGAVYVYKRVGTTWAQEAYIKATNNNSSDSFGGSDNVISNVVSLSGDTLAIGAVEEDSNQTTITNGTSASTNNSSSNSGAVYIYRNKARLFEVTDIWASSDSSSITLNWHKSGGSATGYIVTYMFGPTAPADCSSGTDTDVGDESTHVESGLASGTTYSFRVCATDGVDMTDGWTISVSTQ